MVAVDLGLPRLVGWLVGRVHPASGGWIDEASEDFSDRISWFSDLGAEPGRI